MKNWTNTWLLPDTHLNHKMLSNRGFRPEDFEQRILRNLSKMVKPPDTLIHLGDVCIGKEQESHETLHHFAQCKTKVLIRGNHDKKSDTWYQEHGWDLVVKELWIQKFGYDILVTHEPVDFTLRGVDGYKPWPSLINLHGHTHGNNHHSVDVGHYYDGEYHRELALEHNDYKPFLLTDKLLASVVQRERHPV